MRNMELLRLVALNINQNKFKSVMTSIGIVVGAATIVLVIGIGKGGQADVAEQFANLNAEPSISVMNTEARKKAVAAEAFLSAISARCSAICLEVCSEEAARGILPAKRRPAFLLLRQDLFRVKCREEILQEEILPQVMHQEKIFPEEASIRARCQEAVFPEEISIRMKYRRETLPEGISLLAKCRMKTA